MSLRGYTLPTKSSKMKAKGISKTDYTDLQKGKSVSERINDLLKESTVIKSDPKPSEQIAVVGLQAQIDALRSAFNTLADVVVEEMNKTKHEVLAETSVIVHAANNKKNDEDVNRVSLDLSSLQIQTKGELKGIEQTLRKDIDAMSKDLETYKKDTQYILPLLSHHLTSA